ncbi:MAG: hypothetical protein R3F61_29790 [Myxococcota bacterium]
MNAIAIPPTDAAPPPNPAGPWRLPTAQLLELLAMDARPRSVLQVGHDPRTTALLRARFPHARIEVCEPESLVLAAPADAIVCVFGLTTSFRSDTLLAQRLAAHLADGGHLALLELRGLLVGPGLIRMLADALVPLHVSEGSTCMGLWRQFLYVGRKGSIVR